MTRDQFFDDWFAKTGQRINRSGKETTEIVGFCMHLWRREIDDIFGFHSCNDSEIAPYYEMYESQRDSLVTEFRRDHYSRRLLIQFSRDFHYSENKDMMPCIESIQILFVSVSTFDVVVKFRSSDVERFYEDLLIIAFLCKNFLATIGYVSYYLRYFFVQFGSLHRYEGDSK